MQISYNFNMVSIVNRRPKLLGLEQALDAFIAHQKEVIIRRTTFDLNHARARYHISCFDKVNLKRPERKIIINIISRFGKEQ